MGTMQHNHDLNLRETFTDGKDIPSPPRAIKAFLHRVYQISDNLISCGICQCPGPRRLKTALLKIHTKKRKSFLRTLESYLLSEAATLSELWLADGLITPPPLLPATVNQREAAEPGEGKKKRHTQPEGKWHTETHNTHKSKYKPCFGSIRGPAGDTLAEFSRRSASAFLVIKLMPGVRDGLRSLLSPLIHLCLLTGPVSCSDIIVFPQSVPFTLASLCWFDRAARCWDRLSHTVKRGLFIFCSGLCTSEPKTLSVSLPRSQNLIWFDKCNMRGLIAIKMCCFLGGLFVLLSVELMKQIYLIIPALIRILLYFAETHYGHICITVEQHILNRKGTDVEAAIITFIAQQFEHVCLGSSSFQWVRSIVREQGHGLFCSWRQSILAPGPTPPEPFPAVVNQQTRTSLPS